jgi:hypothetical protein
MVAGQFSKLQDEISKRKVDKLELLRQNVGAQYSIYIRYIIIDIIILYYIIYIFPEKN